MAMLSRVMHSQVLLKELDSNDFCEHCKIYRNHRSLSLKSSKLRTKKITFCIIIMTEKE